MLLELIRELLEREGNVKRKQILKYLSQECNDAVEENLGDVKSIRITYSFN